MSFQYFKTDYQSISQKNVKTIIENQKILVHFITHKKPLKCPIL